MRLTEFSNARLHSISTSNVGKRTFITLLFPIYSVRVLCTNKNDQHNHSIDNEHSQNCTRSLSKRTPASQSEVTISNFSQTCNGAQQRIII